MQNCALTLVQTGYEADVTSNSRAKVVKHLPVNLHSKSVNKVGSII